MKIGSKFLFTKIEANERKNMKFISLFFTASAVLSSIFFFKDSKKKSLFICNLVANKETLCRFKYINPC